MNKTRDTLIWWGIKKKLIHDGLKSRGIRHDFDTQDGVANNILRVEMRKHEGSGKWRVQNPQPKTKSKSRRKSKSKPKLTPMQRHLLSKIKKLEKKRREGLRGSEGSII